MIDPDQAALVAAYSFFVVAVSLIMNNKNPNESLFKIALWAGASLPILGTILAIFGIVLWINQKRAPDDTDYHAMALIGSALLGILSVICGVLGFCVSLITVGLWRRFRK